MKHISTILKAVLLVYAVLFCVFNAKPVELTVLPKFLSWNLSWTVPLFLPVMAAMIIGVLLVIWVFMTEKFAAGKEIKKLRKSLEESEKELERLHALTATGETKKAE